MIRLDVVAPVLDDLGLCTSCELLMGRAGMTNRPAERTLNEYPQDWQQEFRRLGDWVYELVARHGDEIQIRVIDPRSPQGLLKSLRYRVRRYPTWLVQGGGRVVGWDRQALEAALERARGG